MSRQHPSSNPYFLQHAKLQWQPGDVPLASGFDDIYFSRQHGLQETEYVFLEHNQLSQRWRQRPLKSSNAGFFVIAETGFGTGLNFLAAWRLWQQHAPGDWRLHFISTEKHPLQPEDLQRSLATWPQLESFAQQLLAQYPVLLPGHHRLTFEDGRVNLHLLLGDATDSLEQLCANDELQQPQLQQPWRVDAWFLDGFAPAKNPSLWNDKLYRQLARLSSPGTTIATFTAVGEVRRGLTRCGFAINKVRGFGSKREMLSGEFVELPVASANPQGQVNGIRAPWFHAMADDQLSVRRVAVIGGGLAGAHTAAALAKRGIQVCLVEAAAQLAAGASGNPQGMLYTKLSPQAGLLNQFTLSSYLYALRHYQSLNSCWDSPPLHRCGVLQLACNPKDLKLLEELRSTFSHLPELVCFLSSQQASTIAGFVLEHPGWFYPGSGWLDPAALCRQLVEHGNIELLLNTQVNQLQQDQNLRWQLLGGDGECLLQADAVVIANSRDAIGFAQCQQLPLKTIRGQITQLPANPRSAHINTVICHEGYLTPAIDGQHHLGATFDLNDSDTGLRAKDHRRNLTSLNTAIPDLFAADTPSDQLAGRAGLRCSSPDYLPLTGRVPDYGQFLQDYAALRKNAHSPVTSSGNYFPGLFLNVGHGSRGLTSTPLCAEIIAAAICREPLPLGRHLQQALNPARFIIRNLIRNKI